MKPSPRYTLNKEDWKKWGRNVLIFSSPLLILFLMEIQKGTSPKVALTLVYAAFLNAIIDLLKKYVSGK